MAASLIVTIVGPDRPGLVNLISDRVTALGGNWLESRMANLAGQFAGVGTQFLAHVEAKVR